MRFAVFGCAVAGLMWVTSDLDAAHSDRGCHRCHMPHHAGTEDDPNASFGVPLWSTAYSSDGLPVFTLYSSKTFNALGTDIGQPDGATKLCLGCHDGSYPRIARPESTARFEPGDLARSHPVSFTYDAALAAKTNGGLKNPSEPSGLGGSISEDLLDEREKVQCSSCHDTHTSGKGEFMLRFDYDVATYTDNVICRACHNK